jgi:diketogulonate reductase-like aldo/keto reductase
LLPTKKFGKTGRDVTEIGMGTYYDWRWIRIAKRRWLGGASKKVRALQAGLDGGMNLIDTAEVYLSEPLVARAIKGRKRDDLFIATKVWHENLHRDDIVASLEKSLRKLETSYVDLYQPHFPSHHIPVQESLAAMEDLQQKGKIRFIGLSNFNLEQLIEAQHSLRRSEIVSVQMRYNLFRREVEDDLLPYCQKNGIAFLAYYPLAHGELALAEKRLEEVCSRNSKTPAQVALNWLTSKQQVFAIPRASTEGHVRENLGASGWRLSEGDIARLEAEFPRAPVSGT